MLTSTTCTGRRCAPSCGKPGAVTEWRPTIVVPHHVFDLVSDLGFENVVELDWWNSYRHRGLTVTHVPSRHWGARVIEDSHRGYGGYVLRDSKHSLYHAGDTAYFSGFREIGQRLAPELAMLPIGAYNPPVVSQRSHQPCRRHAGVS